MTHFPAHMSRTEQTIVNKLITKIIKAGYQMQVRDPWEGDNFTEVTATRRTIQEQVAAMDETALHVFEATPAGHRWIGYFLLVHGNEEDVVSDIGGRDDETLAKLDALDG